MLVVLLLCSVAAGAERGGVDFGRDVGPIFARHCNGCHGPAKRKGGLRLDRKADALAGGDSGPVIVPGKSGESHLFALVSGADPDEVMPPTGAGERLTPAEVERLRAWIDAGAPWPDQPDASAPVASDHWAFRPVHPPAPPQVRDAAWVRNPIDAFVLARLEAEGIAPSPEADRATLLRRLALDLTGLLPTPADAEAFLTDDAPGSYERLVDRLLASPHFGERWGRHWLDLARYADSNGYERDDVRPNAWRYRDWVIRAVNDDLPFDRFVTAQLAGDLLPDAGLAEQTAAGFHRMTLTNTESGVNKDDYRNREVVDRVNTTGTALLGLTVGCAQCHSHKYDPITLNEYYQLYAYFENTAEVDRPLDAAASERVAYEQALQAHKAKAAALNARKALLEAVAKAGGVDAWRAGAKSARADLDALGGPAELVDAFLAGARTDEQVARVRAFEQSVPARLDDVGQQVRRLGVEERFLAKPAVMTLAESAKDRRVTHVRLRGDFKQKGPQVSPGTPAVLPALSPRGAVPDRLDLARWIVAPENPLTPRVAVNHAWAHLFGRGLVATVDDFGTRGEKPSHPDLLDWLAAEFRDGGSRKALIRLIVASSTYRQSSRTRPDLTGRDPLNTLLARQGRFRVEGEVVRDLFLTASGLLYPAVGGKTIRPPAPASIRDVGYKYKLVWDVSPRPDCYRRGMYIHLMRSNPYPSLMMFDCPETTVCLPARNRSNTPLQALALLNDPVFVECARALGLRGLREGPDDVNGRLRLLGRVCLTRELSSDEVLALADLYDAERRAYAADPASAKALLGDDAEENPAEGAAWTAVARALLNLDEFLTRE